MKAVVRDIHSPDVELDTYQPDDPKDVGLLIQIFAGPADGPGEESFDVVVRTPHRLAREVDEQGPLFGRHQLIVDHYDLTEIRRVLTNAVEAEEAPTWSELAERIARIGKWEFEDYRPSP